MTTEEMIKVMQAYANGSEIESRKKEPLGFPWVWCHTPIWDWSLFSYRIKQPVKWEPTGTKEIVLPGKIRQVTKGIETKFLEDCKQYGIVFNTFEEAMAAKKAFRKYHRLYQLSLELNEGWEPNWSNRSAKYFIEKIECENGGIKWVWDQYGAGQNPIGIYFKDQITVEKAIEMIEAGALD